MFQIFQQQLACAELHDLQESLSPRYCLSQELINLRLNSNIWKERLTSRKQIKKCCCRLIYFFLSLVRNSLHTVKLKLLTFTRFIAGNSVDMGPKRGISDDMHKNIWREKSMDQDDDETLNTIQLRQEGFQGAIYLTWGMNVTWWKKVYLMWTTFWDQSLALEVLANCEDSCLCLIVETPEKDQSSSPLSSISSPALT